MSIYSKQQTDTQAKKLFLLTNDRYSKWGFNVSNKFLNRDFSEENLLQEPAKDNLKKFVLENLQSIDEFEKDFISRWTEQSKENNND